MEKRDFKKLNSNLRKDSILEFIFKDSLTVRQALKKPKLLIILLPNMRYDLLTKCSDLIRLPYSSVCKIA